MRLGILALALAVPLALNACAGGTLKPPAPETQAAVDTGAAITCGLMEAADTAFNHYADPKAGHNVTADKIKLEGQFYAGVHEACRPPYTLDLATLVKKAMNAYNAITALSSE